MLARIIASKRLSRSLNYNEQKVTQGKAVCLEAVNFVKAHDQMKIGDKLWLFERLTSLNERTTVNCLHASINFHPSDRLNDEKLKAIAGAYMRKIGFSDQPYLVYRHDDTGHPHIHLVSTNIRPDGKAISFHNIGRDYSLKAAKEIELEFDLVKVDSKKLPEVSKWKPSPAQRVIYGKTETVRGISNVLINVIDQYKFVSLTEFNAVLRLYHVDAYNGKEGSFLYRRRGLLYRVLDKSGKNIGIPIKASFFYFKPTFKNLEKKFAENVRFKAQEQRYMKMNIDWQLLGAKTGLQDLIRALGKERISTVLRQNKEGTIENIFFIDHFSGAVFSGTELGEKYGWAAILERCGEHLPLWHLQKRPLREMYLLSENLEFMMSPGPHQSLSTSERKKISAHQGYDQSSMDGNNWALRAKLGHTQKL